MTVSIRHLASIATAIGLLTFASTGYATSCDLTHPGTSIDCRYLNEIDNIEVSVNVDINGQLVKNSNVTATAVIANVSNTSDPKVSSTAVGNNLAGENVRVMNKDAVNQAVLFSNVQSFSSVTNSNLNRPLTVEATSVGNNVNLNGTNNRLGNLGQAVVGSNVTAVAEVRNNVVRGNIEVNATAVGNNINLNNTVVRP